MRVEITKQVIQLYGATPKQAKYRVCLEIERGSEGFFDRVYGYGESVIAARHDAYRKIEDILGE